MLDIVPSYNPVQYHGQLIMQTWENGKKPSFDPILALWSKFTPLKLYANSLYKNSRKTYYSKVKKMMNNLILGLI